MSGRPPKAVPSTAASHAVHSERMAGRQTLAPDRPRSSCRACLAQVHAAVGLGVDQGALQQAGGQHLQRA